MQAMVNKIGKKCRKQNTSTVLVNAPPSELLPNRPATKEAVANMYELKVKTGIISIVWLLAFPRN